MARYTHHSNGSGTWRIECDESAPLSARLKELREIFNYYTDEPKMRTTGDHFLLQLVGIQTAALEKAARQQEDDMALLKREIAALKKDVAEMKNPPSMPLDKPKPSKNTLPS